MKARLVLDLERDIEGRSFFFFFFCVSVFFPNFRIGFSDDEKFVLENLENTRFSVSKTSMSPL